MGIRDQTSGFHILTEKKQPYRPLEGQKEGQQQEEDHTVIVVVNSRLDYFWQLLLLLPLRHETQWSKCAFVQQQKLHKKF